MIEDSSSLTNSQKLTTPKKVRFGNGQLGIGCGVGNLRLLSNDTKRVIKLKGVLHVPNIAKRLISLSSMTHYGNKGQILDDKILINDKSVPRF